MPFYENLARNSEQSCVASFADDLLLLAVEVTQ